MLGAIIGDIIGSIYENSEDPNPTDLELFNETNDFTDDTVLTVAVAQALLDQSDIRTSVRDWGRRYPNAGYGGVFYWWLAAKDPPPYQSFGLGAAMRISPVGYVGRNEDEVCRLADAATSFSHNHPIGILGAESTAMAIHWIRQGVSKAGLAARLRRRYAFDFSLSETQWKSRLESDLSCLNGVPAAINAFLISKDYPSSMRAALRLDADADTLCCIAGALAGAYYGVPPAYRREAEACLPGTMWEVVNQFTQAYPDNGHQPAPAK